MKTSSSPAIILAAVYTCILYFGSVAGGGPAEWGGAARLSLERGFPVDKRVEVSQLKARDRVRHRRLLNSQNDVVDFTVYGSYDPFSIGLYYTKVKLGTPAQEFHVQIDTGSDVLWVSCTSCSGCPTSTNLKIGLNEFDATKSSTSSTISCSDSKCSMGKTTSESVCNSQTDECSYQFQYGDGSGTYGHYVYDVLHLDTTSPKAKVAFGCSTLQSGNLANTSRGVDGILGLGQQSLSIISQLWSQGVSPQAFSHCLRGDSAGGGILVLGEIVEPGMLYTPLVPNMPHYNINLKSISVDGQTLSIDSSVFATSSSSSSSTGTIIDSGTTLAYFPEAAYNPLVAAVNNAVSQSARSVTTQGVQCYLITSSADEVFPKVSLNFEGGGSMILHPHEYLLHQSSLAGVEQWCMGIQNNQAQYLTILGDLVLQDKAVVYDLARQRIGWVDYDCSTNVNVTTNLSGSTTFINTGQVNGSGSSTTGSPFAAFILAFITAFLTCLL